MNPSGDETPTPLTAEQMLANWNLQVPLPQELRVRVRSEMLRKNQTLMEFVGAALERELAARLASTEVVYDERSYGEYITDELLSLMTSEAERRVNDIKAARKIGTIAAIEWALNRAGESL